MKTEYQQELARTVKSNSTAGTHTKKLINFLELPSEINNEILVTWKRYRKCCFLKCVLFAVVKITYSENYCL